MPRLLLLMRTQTYRAHAFLAAARALDVEVTVGSDRAQALAHLNPAGHLVLDFRDAGSAAARAAEFARTTPIAAVIGADDDGALLAARIAEGLGLAAHPAAAVAVARDKARAREAFARAGLPSPAFVVAPVARGAAAALAEWSGVAAGGEGAAFPCVLKPRGLAASRGVIRADDAASFERAFARIARILGAEPDPGPDHPAVDSLVIESFIPGAEFALEGVMTDGELTELALFDKPDPLEGPYFEETIYVTPSRLAPDRHREVTEAARRAALALGLVHGPIHAELRLNAAGAWPLEIAPRSIGGLCSRTLRFEGGGSLETVLLAHALGRTAVPRREPDAAGVMMIPIPRAGRLREVRGAEAARGIEGIEDLRLTIPVGTRLVPLPEGAQYLGFLFARGSAADAVERSLREAHARLTFDIEAPEPGEETS